MVWNLGNFVAAGEIHELEIVISRIQRITNIVFDEDDNAVNGGNSDNNADSGPSTGVGLAVAEDNESLNGRNPNGAANKSPEIEDDENEEVAQREPSSDVDPRTANENGLSDDEHDPDRPKNMSQEREDGDDEEVITDRRPNAEREPFPDLDPPIAD